MRKRFKVLFILLIAGLSVEAQNLSGSWAGFSNLFPSSPGFIQALFDQGNAKGESYFSAPGWNAAKRKIQGFSRSGQKILFRFPSAAKDDFVCEGEIKGDLITGTIRRGETKGTFHLVKTGKSTSTADVYVGAYEIKPGNVVLITWGAFAHLRAININEGSSGDALLPLDGDRFFLGRSVGSSEKPTEIVQFNRDAKGKIAGFSLFKNDTLLLTAGRVNWYKQQQVHFQNGKVTLAGTLLKPKNNMPHAAVVFIHGSQDRGRDDNYLFGIADSYLQLGIAVLIYDKRGVGGSTGDWHYASFEDLAEDALAGVRYLRREKDINPSQIGLEAISQGGWIAPIAAAKDKKVAFMVLISAAGVPSKDQVTYDHLGRAKRAGATEAELKEAADFYALQYKAPNSKKDWDAFQAAIPAVKDKKWFSNTMGGIPRESWLWESTKLTAAFDPVTVLPKINCPVLLIFGGADPNYAAEVSAERMKQALQAGGNNEVTIKIFEGANHSILVQGKDGRWGPAPDPENTKYNWLIKNVDVDF